MEIRDRAAGSDTARITAEQDTGRGAPEPDTGSENRGLRHVRVENSALPAIEIYCVDPDAEPPAKAVGYGIEEEGLPYKIITKKLTGEEAYELTRRAGPGVVVLAAGDRAAVYTRQMKRQKPLFDIRVTEDRDAGTTGETNAGTTGIIGTVRESAARILGKNAARIVKNKPFLGFDE